MKRQNPTKQLIIEVCTGKNIPGAQRFIECVHHGLKETSLSNFYPFLDLNEVIGFEAGSWQARFRNDFRLDIEKADIYDIFSYVYGIGMPWFNKHKEVSENLNPKYERLNPFKGKDLMSRLEGIGQEHILKLRSDLQEETNEYVFECQYQERKRERKGDNYKIEIMYFQPVYPKSGKIIPSYASEIASIISSYPKEVLLPEIISS